MAQKKVGKVSHYYDKIGVAVLELEAPLAVGDQIKIVKRDQEFTQEVSSMQKDHKPVQKAKKGDEVGMKVDQEVGRKAQIFKVETK